MKSSKAGVSTEVIGDHDREMTTELEVIGQHMAKLKVKALPRNYQLFHEALYGDDFTIAREITALGPAPSQASLDDIGLKHRLVSHCGLVARKSESDAAEMLREVADQLAEGFMRKQSLAHGDEALRHDTADMDSLNAILSNLLHYETELTERLRDCSKAQALVNRARA
ncbi:MAG: hypothetical protein KGI75_10360 [Rhizobiaceae bacterium]|nr:hypothetical protein [Rhizobiaceae bacterium]